MLVKLGYIICILNDMVHSFIDDSDNTKSQLLSNTW